MSSLVLVPTPVGNLEDITLRAIRMLKEADCIYAEDTRVTKKLLNHFEIHKPVYPFHAHNEHRTLEFVIDKIKENTPYVILVEDEVIKINGTEEPIDVPKPKRGRKKKEVE